MTTASGSDLLAHLRVLDLSRMYPGGLRHLAARRPRRRRVQGRGAEVRRRHALPHRRWLRGRARRAQPRQALDDARPASAGRPTCCAVSCATPTSWSSRIGPARSTHRASATRQLREENPALVWCAVTGFGQTGPYAEAPGHDITYLGAAGAARASSRTGGRPDPTAAHVRRADGVRSWASRASSPRIAQRDRTGHGAFVDASLTDAAMWAVNEDVAASRGRAGTRVGPTSPARWVYAARTVGR